jgi:hypothetical protein
MKDAAIVVALRYAHIDHTTLKYVLNRATKILAFCNALLILSFSHCYRKRITRC